jgi:predicted nucleic acid-binding protein
VIVVDASAVLEVLLRTPVAPAIERRLFGAGEGLHAPHLIDIEVAHVLRRCAAGGDMGAERGREALEDLADLSLHRYSHDVLLPRVWELRANLTAYDAAYVALAEALGAPLITRDRRLGGAVGHRATVEVV